MLISDLPKNKHTRYLHAALGAALLCPGVGGNRNNTFRLGSALVYKKNILVVKGNSAKTHPYLIRFTKYPFLHSESNAILANGLDNCSGASLYVLRILRSKELAMAKPCDECMLLIRSVGIKKIYYTTPYGYEELFL